MKNKWIKINGIIWLMVMTGILISSCSDYDDDDPVMPEETYSLESVSDPMISGDVLFRKQSETTTLVVIELEGTSSGGNHPAHIHANNASTGGPIVISLSPVDGALGRSETLVTIMDDGTPITYEQLLVFDGHVNVHLSPTNLATLIAQGDIGANSP